jgi:hypothetical protein
MKTKNPLAKIISEGWKVDLLSLFISYVLAVLPYAILAASGLQEPLAVTSFQPGHS